MYIIEQFRFIFCVSYLWIFAYFMRVYFKICWTYKMTIKVKLAGSVIYPNEQFMIGKSAVCIVFKFKKLVLLVFKENPKWIVS